MTKKHESWKNESLLKNDCLHMAERSWWHCFNIIIVVVAAATVVLIADIFFASVAHCPQRIYIVTYQFSLKAKQNKNPFLPYWK